MKAPKYRKYTPKKILKQLIPKTNIVKALWLLWKQFQKRNTAGRSNVYINVTPIEMTLQTYKNKHANVLFFLQVHQVVKSI